MKKNLIIAGIAMFCLSGMSSVSSASTGTAPVVKKITKLKKNKKRDDYATGYYENSNAFDVTVTFWQFGHPTGAIILPGNYASGSYTVPTGTYDVVFSASGPAKYFLTDNGSQQGTSVTFSNITFTTGSYFVFTCDLPE